MDVKPKHAHGDRKKGKFFDKWKNWIIYRHAMEISRNSLKIKGV